MFTPKYPPPDTAPAAPAPAPVTDTPASTTPAPVPVPVSAPVVPVSNRPTIQLTPGSALALAASGGAVVLVIGAVLVSMLLAVAITAASVAVCALVVRSLISQERKR
ncbi:SpdD protein [Streptomyces sp. NPDC020792]|uniref:SpdD protein n=1 Tax=Streptomyces sp. NPDC020792 TaxID=3365089 RepID=UPI0037A11FC3